MTLRKEKGRRLQKILCALGKTLNQVQEENEDYDSEWLAVLSDEDEQVVADDPNTTRFSHHFAKNSAKVASDD